MKKEWFYLSGLNRGFASAGFPDMYATCEILDKEGDWFHSKISIENTEPLWNYCKNNWKERKVALIEFDDYSSSGIPINPTIIKVDYFKNIFPGRVFLNDNATI